MEAILGLAMTVIIEELRIDERELHVYYLNGSIRSKLPAALPELAERLDAP